MNPQESNNNSDVDLLEEIVYHNTKSNIFSLTSYYSFNSALFGSEIFPGTGSSFLINSNSVEKKRSKSQDKSM